MDYLVVCVLGSDDLDELHDLNWIKEMQTYELLRTLRALSHALSRGRSRID